MQCHRTHPGTLRFPKALDYLIGKEFFMFLMISELDLQFAAEVPSFVAECRRIFAPAETRNCLKTLERTMYKPLMGAEELLRFSRARQLLLP